MTLPPLIYGTAWKEEHTRALVETALAEGFVGIDTANQRKHYHEAAVGEAVANFLRQGRMKREELFLQTKFTFARGQDHRLPYDPAAAPAMQVKQSFAKSLEHLRTSYVDSYVLHGPSQGEGLANVDWETWGAMERLHDEGSTLSLGVSNVTLAQLRALHKGARVKPTFVQNRCYARLGWDAEVREFCSAERIVYQGFSLLTANRKELERPTIFALAQRLKRPVPAVVFAFARSIGILPLTGTTSASHMRDDLASVSITLTDEEMALFF